MFTFHADPGHAWLQVPRKMLTDLGIAAEISGYSYQSGPHVYLEEDMDFSTFARAYIKEHGKPPEFEEAYREVTPIRGYSPYQAR